MPLLQHAPSSETQVWKSEILSKMQVFLSVAYVAVVVPFRVHGLNVDDDLL